MRIERVLLEDLAGVGFAPGARVSVPLDGFTVIVGRNCAQTMDNGFQVRPSQLTIRS